MFTCPPPILDVLFISQVEYGLSEIYRDLLTFSAWSLSEGGRVAFWAPVVREDYSEEKLPSHPGRRGRETNGLRQGI